MLRSDLNFFWCVRRDSPVDGLKQDEGEQHENTRVLQPQRKTKSAGTALPLASGTTTTTIRPHKSGTLSLNELKALLGKGGPIPERHSL